MNAIVTAVLVVALILFAVLFVVSRYNRLVRLRNACKNSWASVDVQLTRRSDLVANLVATVQGYAAHERTTLEAVIQARNRTDASRTVGEREATEGPFVQALGRLFALQEAYPTLKADRSFIALQEQLAVTENTIAYARQAYNDAATSFNTAIQTFPTSLIASASSFAAQDLFRAHVDATIVPVVQF